MIGQWWIKYNPLNASLRLWSGDGPAEETVTSRFDYKLNGYFTLDFMIPAEMEKGSISYGFDNR